MFFQKHKPKPKNIRLTPSQKKIMDLMNQGYELFCLERCGYKNRRLAIIIWLLHPNMDSSPIYVKINTFEVLSNRLKLVEKIPNQSNLTNPKKYQLKKSI